MAKRFKVKATFEIDAEAKHRLATFKADLRRDGRSVSEAEIVEALLLSASAATIRKALSAAEND